MKIKNKLIATAVMLVISIIMMSTASFAWFTISTAPEVKGISATAVTNENLEIVLDKGDSTPGDTTSETGNAYTWGNLVDLSTVTEYSTFMGSGDTALTIRPATLESGTFKAPTYGADGRMNTDLGKLKVGSPSNAFGKVTDDNNNVYAYFIDFKVRTNMTGTTLSFSAADDRAEGVMTGGAGSTVTSTNKMFLNNFRIAYSLNGGAITAVTPSVSGTTGTITENIGSLTANTATTLRIFFYVEGANVTNAMFDTTAITAAVNLQFTNGADAPMNVPITAAAG